jgi:hypothetical protein
VPEELDQAQRRRPVVLKDQWGRKWESTIDTISGGTCAPINPKGWVDVLNTPVKFKRLAKDEDGMLSLNILVDEWIAYLERKHEEYDQKLYGDAMMLFGAEGPAAYEERKPALVNYTGDPPQAIEPILALQDENSWILGRTTTPDPRLTKYFVKKTRARPSFKDEDLEDLEHQYDPNAVGGKKVPVGKRKRVAEEVG